MKNTVRAAADVVGKGVVGRGKAAPKAALDAAKSLRTGRSPVTSAVSERVTALKKAAGRASAKPAKKAKKATAPGGGESKVTNIIEEIDIGAPRRLVYDQWTRFQDFPAFTGKVERAEQVGDEKVRWKARILWSSRTWESTIVEQAPDERIVWRSTGDKGYVDGAVTFHELSPDLTRVLLVLEYHPRGLVERVGNLWRAQGRRARLELKHFRRHVMTRTLLAKADDVPGWRGEIHDGQVVRPHEDATTGENDENGEKKRSGTRSSRTRSSATKSSGTKSSGTRSSGTRSSSAKSSGAKSSGAKSSGGGSSSSSTKRSSATGRRAGRSAGTEEDTKEE